MIFLIKIIVVIYIFSLNITHAIPGSDDITSPSVSRKGLTVKRKIDNKSSPSKRLHQLVDEHLWGLEANSPSCGKTTDSRIRSDKSIISDKDLKWHERMQQEIKSETEAIRQLLSGKYGPDKTNLLRARLVINLSDSQQPAQPFELEFDEWFVSGWPTRHKQNKLQSLKRDRKFYFIKELVDDFDTRYSSTTATALVLAKELRQKILDGTVHRQYSFLETNDYEATVKRSIREKEGEKFLLADLQSKLLHTEQALLFFLAKILHVHEVFEGLKNKFNTQSTVKLTLHICSYEAACLLCGDRLFLESEWGKTFIQKLRDQGLKFKKFRMRFVCSYVDTKRDKEIDSHGADFKHMKQPYIRHLKIQ